MGFIKAFTGALSGTFADQWKDYYMPMADVPVTAGLFPAVPQGTNNGRGENTKGYDNIISDGSKIVVPEGTALITVQDGAITGCITEPGGFEFKSNDPNSQSIFAGDGIIGPLVKSTWEKVKFGGQPAAQQLAFYVNLKEIPNNKIGTKGNIQFFDAYLKAQVGLIARGVYTFKIADPLAFVKNCLGGTEYLQPGAPIFDFADMDNALGNELFVEALSCFTSALSKFAQDPSKEHSIINVVGSQEEFTKIFVDVLETEKQWKSRRGFDIISASVEEINYDEKTQALVESVAQADAFAGERADTFMKMSVARGMEAAGQNGGGAAMAFMGMGMNAANGMMGAMQQQPQPQPQPAQDPTTKLLEMKKLLDAGAISQEEYDKVKAEVLGS